MSARRARPAPAAAPTLEPRAAARAAAVLWSAAALLVVARPLAAWLPGMGAWGLNVMRFLAPGWAWAPWALAALALVPAAGRAPGAALDAVGRWLRAHPVIAPLAVGTLAAALVAALPDRTWFTGDFLQRYVTVEFDKGFAATFPQSMPLDALLHDALPRALMEHGVAALTAARGLGALEAGLLGALAARAATVLALEGAAAGLAVALVIGGGWLALFTGYLKTAGELCVLTVGVGLTAVRVLRDGRGLAALGALLALGLALHRAALLLLPPAAIVVAIALARPGAWRRPDALAGLALPLAALAVLGPRLAHVLTTYDVAHHLDSPAVRASGGLLAGALAGPRALDLANTALALAPLALTLPVLALLVGRAAWRRPETVALALFAGAAALGALLVHPQQGLFRDWDVLAPAAIAAALLLAWWAGLAVRARGGAALAVALALGALMPALQWTAQPADAARGLARAHAFVTGPPRRGDDERARTLDFLADRDAQLGRWEDAAAVLSEAVALAPSPRLLREWAMAEQQRDDLAGARLAWRTLVAHAPDDPAGWGGLAAVAATLGDSAEALAAVDRLERLRPGEAITREVRARWPRPVPR